MAKKEASEKEGKRVSGGEGFRFVVQEHHATRLHWDFRLEMEGVLWSWAVPKGPPLEQGVKRLAIRVEDHTLSHIDFEGTIREGEYGAGKVIVWDRGTYSIESLKEDKIVFWLNGGKLRGRYTLLHTGENQWLLFKTVKQAHP